MYFCHLNDKLFMSLVVDNLTKVFGSQVAVNHISFTARPGEILGFLGPNGAGKSTTMKMICGYHTPTSGTVVVSGYDIVNDKISAQKEIGYLPESNPLYLDMYVREYLDFVADIHQIKNKKNRISDLIEQTGLEKEQHKLIGQLSKGYKQRVGLAQALIHDPSVLIMDEPTSGLDMNQLVDIRTLIKNLGKEKTLMFSSHIMQEVQALCDRVIIINDGNLVADDPIQKLKEEIDENYELLLKFEGGVDDQKLLQIEGVTEVNRQGEHVIVRYSKKMDLRPAIFRFCAAHEWVLIEMKLQDDSIENIFHKITSK